MLYEITVRRENGDDLWWRATHNDYHDAVLSGIAKTMKVGHIAHHCRLVRVELIPEDKAIARLAV
jgi:hypothetical protein